MKCEFCKEHSDAIELISNQNDEKHQCRSLKEGFRHGTFGLWCFGFADERPRKTPEREYSHIDTVVRHLQMQQEKG
jgi:hypothetical protein